MPRKPRHLSPEERALWSSVARTAKPLVSAKLTPPPAATAPPAAPAKRRRISAYAPVAPRGAPPAPQVDLAPSVEDFLASGPAHLDRKALKRLGRGKLKPEARIDLHGMTLARAHPELSAFIRASHAAGRRLVLVITGKGRGGSDGDGPIPVRRGVLRDQVPRWLHTAPLAPLVLQVVPAHISHGGEGAWYVYLRRARK